MSTEYVALQAIDHRGVRAFNPGDPVPAANVDKHGYTIGEQVAAVDSAPSAAGDASEDPSEQAADTTPRRRRTNS